MADKIITGNFMYDYGFTMCSNLLIDYQDKLNLTNDDIIFIIKVLRHKSGYRLHDSCLDSTLSTKTLQRRRKALVDKGYLTFKVIKATDETGAIITQGILYDLTELNMALIGLANELNEKEAEVKISKPAFIAINHDDYYSDFQKEYYKRYNKEYHISNIEKTKLKSLKKEEKESIKYIFDYIDDNLNNLPTDFHPRLSFFIKLNWRMEKLVEYYNMKKDELENNIQYEKLVEIEKAAKIRYNNIITTETEEKEFNKFLKENNKILFLRKRVSSLAPLIDSIEDAYKKWTSIAV